MTDTLVNLGTWVSSVLIDSSVKACLVLSVAAIAALALRRSSAAMRHLTWGIALTSVLLIPILSRVLPDFRVLPQSLGVIIDSDSQIVFQDFSETAILNPLNPVSDGTSANESEDLERSLTQTDHVIVSAATWSFTPHSIIAIVWVAGVALMVLRVLLSGYGLSRLVRTAEKVTVGTIANELKIAGEQLDIRHPVNVYVSSQRAIPMAWGLFPTNLLLPAEAKEWELGRLRAVLLHELGHVKRHDLPTHVLTQLIGAVYWFHPFVWFATWRSHVERERACDDVVVASGMLASEYAHHLLAIITGFSKTRVPSAALAMSKHSILEGRIMAILNESICRKQLSRGTFATWITAGVLVSVAVATLHAKPQDRVDDITENQEAISTASGKELEGGPLKSSSHPSDVSAEERAAESALKEYSNGGWRSFERNRDGLVIAVRLSSERFGNEQIDLLAKLSWDTTSSSRPRHGGLLTDTFPCVNLSNATITNSGVERLLEVTKFSSLDLAWNTNINDQTLALLKNQTQLKELHLGGTSITDDGLAQLRTLTDLNGLGIESTKISDAGLAHIGKLRNLEVIYLNGTKITNNGLQHLHQLQNLKYLWLQDTDITDAGLAHLKALPKLLKVQLANTKISDAGLAHFVKNHKGVISLLLSGTSVSDEGLAEITGLPRLIELHLGQTGVTDASLKHIQRWPMLSSLELTGTKVSDAGLTHLKGLKYLAALSLSGTAVTDNGLVSLEGCSNLRQLSLGETAVTQEGIARLSKALPKCNIHHGL